MVNQRNPSEVEAVPQGRLESVPYRWVAMGVVLFGTFMVVLDTTIVNLGLSSLQDEFQDIHGVEWAVSGYLIAVGVSQLSSGWVGDRFGRRRTFIGALIGFTLASMLCAIAPTLPILVVARVLQGIGGGLLIPVGMAMIYELFEPNERGRALSYFGIAVMVAPAIGPVLGGTVVSSVGWRWLFLINVPIGMVGVPVAIRLLRDTGYREIRRFDVSGFLLSTTGLVALLVGLQQAGVWGWSSTSIIALLTAGTVLIVLFCVHALRHPQPLADIRIFANRVFAPSMIAIGLMTVAMYSRLVYIPLELGSARDVDELKIGLVMLPSALGVAVMMPVGGRLVDRIGARTPFLVGVAVLVVSFWPLAHLTPDTDLTWIALALFVGGLGTGISVMAPNVVAMNSVHASRVAQAAGLSQVSRQLSAAFGTAFMASIFASALASVPPSDTTNVDAYNTVFQVALIALVLAGVAGLALAGKTRADELRRERTIERQALASAGLLTDRDIPPPMFDH